MLGGCSTPFQVLNINAVFPIQVYDLRNYMRFFFSSFFFFLGGGGGGESHTAPDYKEVHVGV